jgi:Domain of unknown function (DUF4893)
MRTILALTALFLSACATAPRPQVTDWRTVATANDRERLREWRTAFVKALEQARAAGHAADIAKEGALLEPDAALGPVPIPNGSYKCRVIKLGAKSKGLLNYIAYPAFRCRISQEKELQGFYKFTGSQRQTGLLYPAGPMRQAFLGTLVLGDESRAMKYGGDQYRDLAGWVERVGDNRWRLILPYPHYESTLDVLELVPEK